MIKGKLVGLRAIEKTDLTQLKDWRNIEAFRKNFREHKELSLANQELWFENHIVSNPNNFMFVIERLQDKKAIGTCGLLYTNWIARFADFSFYIGENEAYIDKNGWAKEATQLLLKYGFNALNLNKIWMELYEFDQKKLDFFLNEFNFQKDGRLRQNCFADGKYWDSFILSLLKSEVSF